MATLAAHFGVAVNMEYLPEGSGAHSMMVPGALPGERIRAHVIKIQKSYAIAKLTEILQASPERVEPECPVYGKCGGCQWMHMAYPHQLTCKRDQVVSCLRRIGIQDGV